MEPVTAGLPDLGIVIATALADSINPCVIGVLLFLVAFLNKTFGSRNRMLLGGLYYTAVVYITYLVLGLGIIEVTVSFGFARTFYMFAAGIAVLAGMLEIKDYLWYGEGFTLQMIPGGSDRVKYYTKKIEDLQIMHPVLGFLFIGVIGVFVVLVELPCTGAPYLAILAVIGEIRSQGGHLVGSGALSLLFIYNLVFVLPLLAVIGFSYFGHTEKMASWRNENRGVMRLGIGIFLILLAEYMIYSVA